jgi:hypothetical protein
MRMRCWAVAVAAAVVVAVAPDRAAAAQPAKGNEPTVEIRLRSINDLLDKGEYVAGLLGKEDVVVQVRELVKQLSADGKGVEGIDPKRPFGVYASLTPDIVGSQVVVMIPIADQERFLQMLKDRASVEPKKQDDGTLKVELPLINEAYFRFANGYLYAAHDPKHLEPRGLITPKAFFANDDGSVASLLVRIDRIPNEVKELLVGQLELAAQEAIQKQKPDPIAKKILSFLTGEGIGGIKMVLDDGKQFTAKVFVDPKADELSAEVVLTPKEGSQLAKNIAGLAGKTSLPAGIASAKDPAVRVTVKIAVPEDQKARYGKFVDEVSDDVLKQVGPNERDMVKRVLTTLSPTVKAGELDAAVVLTGPDTKGKYTLLAAVSVKDGKKIEELVKEFSQHIPPDEVGVTFDVEKVGNFSLHKIEIKRGDPEFERIFGTKTIWLATSDDCYALCIGPDASALRTALKAAKPAPVPVLSVEVSLAKVVPLAQPDLKPDELKAAMREAFGDQSPAGKDTVIVTVEGGKQLTARAKVKGKGIKLIASLEPFKIK